MVAEKSDPTSRQENCGKGPFLLYKLFELDPKSNGKPLVDLSRGVTY